VQAPPLDPAEDEDARLARYKYPGHEVASPRSAGGESGADNEDGSGSSDSEEDEGEHEEDEGGDAGARKAALLEKLQEVDGGVISIYLHVATSSTALTSSIALSSSTALSSATAQMSATALRTLEARLTRYSLTWRA